MDRWRPDVILVDGRHLLYRTADAHRELEAEDEKGERQPTGGVYGTLNVLVKLRKRYRCGFILAWEGSGNFRFELYPDYKRRAPPTQDVIRFRDEIQWQEGQLRDILSRLGVRQYEAVGGEADDVLGTLVEHARGKGLTVGVFSGDGDLHQLVDDHCRVIQPQPRNNEKVWDAVAVRERWGVDPTDLPLFKALSGDNSDNIPGVTGIGPKIAGEMVNAYGTLPALLHAAREGEWKFTERLRELIRNAADKLPVFLQLTEIRRNMKLKAHAIERDPMAARRMMAALKFRRLLEHSHFHELKGLAL